MSVFKKGSIMCFVSKDDDEPYEHFIDRGNFIISQNPTNDKEYNKAVMYSRFYINTKVLRCTYTKEIMEELEEMINKCKCDV